MPRKRPLDVRMAEAEEKLEKMKLEKAIMEMKTRFGIRRRRRSNSGTRR